ncbi:VOC family protein [Nocardia sp. CA2R105]|uniref:VOC family protein n=1 Tax=Nocardia coffeae TaxID=2873381 RepID=UPI001CA7A9A4|nr:VOC family protein [Nocardia coffeae]MBY8860905.1 VOC family protein [Nocardia coffeae]
MPIHRLNHAVLFVSDVERSTAFYRDVLGFRLIGAIPGGVFLQAAGSSNDHDLGLFQTAEPPPGASRTGRVGLYHLAWEVDTLRELERLEIVLRSADALTGAANHAVTKSLYGMDPDGIEFEVCWLVPDAAVETELGNMTAPSMPLDLAAETDRYGADTLGGPRRPAAQHRLTESEPDARSID